MERGGNETGVAVIVELIVRLRLDFIRLGDLQKCFIDLHLFHTLTNDSVNVI